MNITRSQHSQSSAHLAITGHLLNRDKGGTYDIPAAAWDLAEATGFETDILALADLLHEGRFADLLLSHRTPIA